jgi:hypothetical protein
LLTFIADWEAPNAIHGQPGDLGTVEGIESFDPPEVRVRFEGHAFETTTLDPQDLEAA